MEQLETITEKPNYTEWLKSLKAKAVAAERDEQGERRWRETYGKG
jgi:hypothetical protein